MIDRPTINRLGALMDEHGDNFWKVAKEHSDIIDQVREQCGPSDGDGGERLKATLRRMQRLAEEK